jgi:hypothetical protein
MRLALGDDHVGVVQQPVNGSGGQTLGKKVVSKRAGWRFEVRIRLRRS